MSGLTTQKLVKVEHGTALNHWRRRAHREMGRDLESNIHYSRFYLNSISRRRPCEMKSHHIDQWPLPTSNETGNSGDKRGLFSQTRHHANYPRYGNLQLLTQVPPALHSRQPDKCISTVAENLTLFLFSENEMECPPGRDTRDTAPEKAMKKRETAFLLAYKCLLLIWSIGFCNNRSPENLVTISFSTPATALVHYMLGLLYTFDN